MSDAAMPLNWSALDEARAELTAVMASLDHARATWTGGPPQRTIDDGVSSIERANRGIRNVLVAWKKRAVMRAYIMRFGHFEMRSASLLEKVTYFLHIQNIAEDFNRAYVQGYIPIDYPEDVVADAQLSIAREADMLRRLPGFNSHVDLEAVIEYNLSELLDTYDTNRISWTRQYEARATMRQLEEPESFDITPLQLHVREPVPEAPVQAQLDLPIFQAQAMMNGRTWYTDDGQIETTEAQLQNESNERISDLIAGRILESLPLPFNLI